MLAKISGNSFGPVLASVYKRAALQASESGGNEGEGGASSSGLPG